MLVQSVLVERRDEEKGDDQPRQGQTDQELNPAPVLDEGLVRHADDGQGADLRGDKRQARDHRGHPPAAQEEVLRVPLPASEDIGDDEQQQDRPGHDEPIEPAERSGELLGDRFFDDP